MKKFSDIKKHFDANIIPPNYSEFFGENASFFFEFLKKNINFDDFVQQKKIEIKKEISDFCDSYCKYYLSRIYEIIEKKEVL